VRSCLGEKTVLLVHLGEDLPGPEEKLLGPEELLGPEVESLARVRRRAIDDGQQFQVWAYRFKICEG
jgi:hypothetical protein